MDWWPITCSMADDQIEWSPQAGIVRAKRKGWKNWRYGYSKKAQWAESMGQDLIQQKGGEKLCLVVLPGERRKKK